MAATFLELVKLSDRPEKEELKQLLLKFEKKAAYSYRRFLLSIQNLKSDLYLEWGSVNPDAGGQASLSKNSIQTTVKYIKFWDKNQDKLITVQGKLLKADITQKTLEIKEIETGKNYAANFDKKLLNHPEINLIIGHLYSTKFQEVTSINPVTGEEKMERTVIELAYLNGDRVSAMEKSTV